MKKLPYIPDKKMYAAVMGACSWIRESGYFTKATQYYANKYGVDVEELRKYVRAAQGNGQRQAAKRNPKKYHWYAMISLADWYYIDCFDVGCYASWYYSDDEAEKNTVVLIKKALSAKNAATAANEGTNLTPYRYLRRMEEPHNCYTIRHTEQFDSQQEAEDYANSLTWDDMKQWVLRR